MRSMLRLHRLRSGRSALNTGTPNTFIRAAITVLSGAAILYAIGRYLGWWVTGAIVVVGLGDAAWCALQL
jgi:hypothetical protein